MRRTGTREWSERSLNCCEGCSHDCIYCYARAMANRFGRRSAPNWSQEELRPDWLRRRYSHRPGFWMFPTTHDLTPGTIALSLELIMRVLKASNKVLIVSKPHHDIVCCLTERLKLWRDQILFRFTVSGLSERVRKFWEPGAPSYTERIEALKEAHRAKYATSVSCEPLLEPTAANEIVRRVSPYVTDTIWIGACNMLRARTAWLLPAGHDEIRRLEREQSVEARTQLYLNLRGNPLIRWKDSYRGIIEDCERSANTVTAV